MSNDWLRLWHDMPNDPKWRSIARASGKPIPAVIAVYIHMLVSASIATERGRTQGWCDEDVANALDLNTEDVTAIREAMQGRVLDNDYLKGWEKRQPKREDGAAIRAKAWREKRKDEEERQRTQWNAAKRPEEDTDTEEELNSEGKPSSSRPSKIGLSESGSFEGITPEKLAVWSKAFPAIDLAQEIARAAAWLVANPMNKKKNHERFLINWLTKSQERAPRVAIQAGAVQKVEITAEQREKNRDWKRKMGMHACWPSSEVAL